jgi:hypothetical protein
VNEQGDEFDATVAQATNTWIERYGIDPGGVYHLRRQVTPPRVGRYPPLCANL